MLTVDRVAGATLGLLAIVVLVLDRALPFGTPRTPGPGYVPALLAALLLAFGVLLILFGGDAEPWASLEWPEWRHAVAIVAACAFAAWALERLGYRLTVAVLVAFLLGVTERKSPTATLVTAVGLAAGTFYLFATLLRVPLPRGPFGL